MDKMIGIKTINFLQRIWIVIAIFMIGIVANAQELLDVVPIKTEKVAKQGDSSSTSAITSMQTQSYQPDMATGMRSNGKIFVVVAVMSMILIGLFIYLFTLDKKISKLEKGEHA